MQKINQCLVPGCTKQEPGRICEKHWAMVPRPDRRRIVEIGPGVGQELLLALAVECIDLKQPHWARGWAQAVRQRADADELSRRDTWQRIRLAQREKHGAGYAERTAGFRVELARLTEQLGASAAIDIALAMIRTGQGLADGFDPLLICAALDLDEAAGRGAARPVKPRTRKAQNRIGSALVPGTVASATVRNRRDGTTGQRTKRTPCVSRRYALA